MFWKFLILSLLICARLLGQTQLVIGVGTSANDGTGDSVRSAFGKVNTNFTYLFHYTTTNSSGGGSGSVTNVALSGGTTGLTVSGSPITSGGTMTLGGTVALANGGTGATTASGARTALGLGTVATRDVGTTTGTAADGLLLDQRSTFRTPAEYGTVDVTGTTFSTTAIQAAIDAGVPVFLPAGTYKIAQLFIPQNCTIQGAGPGLTILQSTMTGTNVAIGKKTAETGATLNFNLSDLTIQNTGGNGGTGLDLNSFYGANIRNVYINLFRNATQGIGLYLHNDFANCSRNHFFGVRIANCDTGLQLDTGNATYSCGYNTWHGLTIDQEHTGIKFLKTGATGPQYNDFEGVFIQATSGGANDDLLQIVGTGNSLAGVVFDGTRSGSGKDINFNATDATGNYVQMIGGYVASRMQNLQSSGAGNFIQSSAVQAFTPGKTGSLTDPLGTLTMAYLGGLSTSGVEIRYGNGTSTTLWKQVMQASASPYFALQSGSTIIHQWFPSGNEIIGGTVCVDTAGVVSAAVASAMLEVRSTGKGFLPPRMTTTQQTAITSPAEGLELYDTVLHKPAWYSGSAWVNPVGSASPTFTGTVTSDAVTLSTATYSSRSLAEIVAVPANTSIILAPSGTGYLSLRVPDGTTTGGNQRGNGAVDLSWGGPSSGAIYVASGAYSIAMGQNAQASGVNSIALSTGANQGCVASGPNSISIGEGGTASGQSSICITPYGWHSSASGTGTVNLGFASDSSGDYSFLTGYGNNNTAASYAFVSGNNAKASNLGQFVHSTGGFTAIGDAQASKLIVRNSTVTNTTPVNLYLDGSSVRPVIPANTTWNARIFIVARNTTSGAAYASFNRHCLVWRGVAAGTTVVSTVQTDGTDIGSNAGSPPSGWSVAVTSDTTNGALQIAATGDPARWVAEIQLTEVANP